MKLRNKIISLITTVVTTITMVSTVSFAAADDVLNFNITSTTVKAGETATVTVSLNNNPGLYALTMYVNFDESFNVPTNADASDCVLLTGNSTVNTEVVLNDNKYMFDWSDNMFTVPVDATGKLFTLQVEVPEGTPAGKYPITVTNEYNCDKDDNEDLALNIANENAYIEVIDDTPTTTKAYFAATLTWGIKAKANTGVEFIFDGADNTAKVPFGTVTFEDNTEVNVGLEVTDIPENTTLTLTDVDWYE